MNVVITTLTPSFTSTTSPSTLDYNAVASMFPHQRLKTQKLDAPKLEEDDLLTVFYHADEFYYRRVKKLRNAKHAARTKKIAKFRKAKRAQEVWRILISIYYY